MDEKRAATNESALRGLAVPAIVFALIALVAWRNQERLDAWFNPKEASQATNVETTHDHGDDDVAHYTCAMHPSVKAQEMGQCPICNMDLTPVTHGELKSGRLRLDSQRMQHIGVRTAIVEEKSFELAIRTQGEVRVDENRLTDLTLRTEGWVERLYVEETFERVKRGQTMLELYSPEVVAASEELLVAHRAQGTSRDRLVRSAEKKLLLLGLSRKQIARRAKLDSAPETLAIAAPATGYVMSKSVAQGAHVPRGQRLYRIADLSRVWIDAKVYEADMHAVKVGAPVRLTLPFVGEVEREAVIDYVHPRLDPTTRTISVRIEVDNPDLELKPGMYAEVVIPTQSAKRPSIPREAIIYSGPRRIVFVDLGEGQFEPRDVETGVQHGEWAQILSGLHTGESVVTSGNFLIAAESRIRSAETVWAPREAATAKTDAHDHDAPSGAYVCPMHPEVRSDEAATCPICKMDLVLDPAANAATGSEKRSP
jgi:Cu(I)/Ag(I) efflux system membrane fusion protein